MTWGKKPRASATSKHVIIDGMKFFFQRSKIDTPFGLVIWNGEPPYQKIKPIRKLKDLTPFESAERWIIENKQEIVKRINDCNNLLFDKNTFETMEKTRKKKGNKK